MTESQHFGFQETASELGSLWLRQWIPAGTPKGGALIVPGFAMHGEPYAPLGVALAKSGVLAAALDVPGNGRTGGRLSLASAEAAVDVAARHIARITGSRPALIGDSAGASYILALGVRTRLASGLGLLAPGVLIRPGRVGGPAAARDVWGVLRGRGMPTLSARLETVSTNPEFLEARRRDPLMLESVGAAYLSAVTQAAVVGFLRARSVSVPVRIWHGTGDRLLPVMGSRLLARRLVHSQRRGLAAVPAEESPNGIVRSSSPLTLVRGGEHGLIWDPVMGARVIEDVVAWVEQLLGSSPPGSTPNAPARRDAV